ncbi:Kinesin-II 95 kDa subunit [Holothuria leucospilota]|uniref:Kinesin-like protein n=1 Tax=Holothuria leucospilota TaxID=206669 RepID=A0A9Q1CRY0_HOLLE|nr:Kinesin-II 95 kDa subunit [Holothuria leucospilota]
MSSKKAESVKVVVRCRPLNSKEKKDGHERVVEMDSKRGLVEIRNPNASSREPPKSFTFDCVYDWNSKQRDLYDETFRPLVESVLNGFNGTIFAYGQTGTGKTYTMEGVRSDENQRGVIPNSFEHIFTHISRTQNQQYLVRASYLEIYQEEVRDLLAKDQTKRLELKERPDTGVYVKDLSSFVTKSVKEIEHVMTVGNTNRSVGSTNMNEHSSRSHAIFIITIECSELGPDGENHIRVGKLNLVDLAGSERQAKTGAAQGERLKEATKINLSLSALGNVISALVDGKSHHIPYRDSKLTRLLQDSLGGNAKTVMVANVGPASYNYDETVTTLRYANRAKNIKNKPKINEDPKDALLREFQDEIARLKEQLATRGGVGGGGGKKRKGRSRRRGEGGVGSDGEIEESDEENGLDEEEMYKDAQQKLEQEKEAILANQNMIAEEKQKLVQEVLARQDQIRKQQEARDALQSKIEAMEGKLLVGGKSIMDHTNQQERELEQRRLKLAEEKRIEREMQQKLESKDEGTLELRDTYSSLQQEVEIKTKKLKKLFAKLQAVKSDIQDLQEEHVRERQELEQTQDELMRELKLKVLIIDNFIPPEEKTKIAQRAEFDEEGDQWVLRLLAKSEGPQQMAKRPVSAVGNRRPVTDYAKMAAQMGGNPRYKAENILQVELDMPNRTTRDYEGPTVAPRVQAALDAALQDEDDLDLEIQPSVFSNRNKGKVKKEKNKARPKVKKSGGNSELYPTARGLIAK